MFTKASKIIAFISLSALLGIFTQANRNISIEFLVDGPLDGTGTLYFDKGDGFDENNKVDFDYKQKNIEIILNSNFIKAIRFHPFNKDSRSTTLRQFKINGQYVPKQQLLLKPLRSISEIKKTNTHTFEIVTMGENPILLLYQNNRVDYQLNKTKQIIIVFSLLAIILLTTNRYTKIYSSRHLYQPIKNFIVLYLFIFTSLLIVVYSLNLNSDNISQSFLPKTLFFEYFFYEYLIVLFIVLGLINRYRLSLYIGVTFALSFVALNIIQLNSFLISGAFITPLALDNTESINLLLTKENVGIITATFFSIPILFSLTFLLLKNPTIKKIITITSSYVIFWSLSILMFSILSHKDSIFDARVINETNELYKKNYFQKIAPVESFIKLYLNKKQTGNITFTKKEITSLKEAGFSFDIDKDYPLIKENIYKKKYNTNRTIKKPNIILILTEGLSARTSTVYGNKYDLLTPNIKNFSLNKHSLIIDNYFNHTAATYRGIAGQLCSIYPKFGGSDGWHVDSSNLPTVLYKCLPHILAHNNYETIYLNMLYKDDSGLDEMVSKFGFDKVISGEDLSYSYLGGINKLIKDRFTDHQSYESLKGYLKKKKNNEQPFFITLYTSETHAWTDIGRSGKKYSAGEKNGLNTIHNMDHAFGEFWEYFKSSNYAKNTIVIFTTDHAHYYEKSFVKTMKEYHEDDYKKFFIDKIPLIIYDPTAKHPSKNFDANGATSINLAPTILHYLNIPNEKNNFLGWSIFEDSTQENIANYGDKTFIIKNNVVYDINDVPEKDKYILKLIDKYAQYLQTLEQNNRLYYDSEKIVDPMKN